MLQVRVCIDTLCKYLDNIVDHPDEEKYQRIRANNKALNERVLMLRGADEFLQAAGFERRMLPGMDGSSPPEEFIVFNKEQVQDVSRLQTLKEVLLAAEPIRPVLDRGTRVFHPSPNAAKIQVPDEFYAVSMEELKREQAIRQEAVEQMGMLRTKQMRDRERQRELRRYRYCLLRVRLPDGLILQGTFHASDRFAAVREFVSECLAHSWIPFVLAGQAGAKLTDERATLAELNLAPASLLNFTFDASLMADIAHEHGQQPSTQTFLRSELLADIASL